MKYFARIVANNYSLFSGPYVCTSKRTALREIRSMLRGLHHSDPCNVSLYSVEDENGETVFLGSLNGRGWWAVLESDYKK